MKKEHLFILCIFAILLLILQYLHLTGFAVTSLNSCSDSDGGEAPGAKGFVWGDFYDPAKRHYEKYDYCINERYLVEYSCSGDALDQRAEEKIHRCALCSEGRCAEEEVARPLSFWEKLWGRLTNLV